MSNDTSLDKEGLRAYWRKQRNKWNRKQKQRLEDLQRETKRLAKEFNESQAQNHRLKEIFEGWLTGFAKQTEVPAYGEWANRRIQELKAMN